MRIRYSRRVEGELLEIFNFGLERFGRSVAETTLRRIYHALEINLAANPFIGRYLADRRLYGLVISRTPFVAYYRIEAQADLIEIVAIFGAGQNRSEFESH